MLPFAKPFHVLQDVYHVVLLATVAYQAGVYQHEWMFASDHFHTLALMERQLPPLVVDMQDRWEVDTRELELEVEVEPVSVKSRQQYSNMRAVERAFRGET